MADIKRKITSTNKPSDFSRRILEHLEMTRWIEAMIGPAEVLRPKPDPAMLLDLAKILEIEPAQAVYVGDMPVDAETARAAGMAVWLLPTGSSPEEELRAVDPDRLLSTMTDVLDYLPGTPSA